MGLSPETSLAVYLKCFMKGKLFSAVVVLLQQTQEKASELERRLGDVVTRLGEQQGKNRALVSEVCLAFHDLSSVFLLLCA